MPPLQITLVKPIKPVKRVRPVNVLKVLKVLKCLRLIRNPTCSECLYLPDSLRRKMDTIFKNAHFIERFGPPRLVSRRPQKGCRIMLGMPILGI